MFASRLRRFSVFGGECSLLFSPLLGNSFRVGDSKKLNKLIKKAGSVLETALKPLELIMQRKILEKQLNMMDNTAKVLQNYTLPLQQRLEQEVRLDHSNNIKMPNYSYEFFVL